MSIERGRTTDPLLTKSPASATPTRVCGGAPLGEGSPVAAGTLAMDAQSAHSQCGEKTVTYRRYESFEQAGELREAWDDLAAAEADVFSSFDWCALWWRHYGIGRDLELHAFFRGGALVAIAPLFRDVIRLGPIRVRIVRIVGCDHSTVTCGLPIRRDCAEDVVAALVDRIVASDWDLIQFGRLPPIVADVPLLLEQLSAHSEVGPVARYCDALPEIVSDLPETFETYLEGLSSRERHNIRKENRRLASQCAIECDDAAAVDGPTNALQQFIDFHQSQWVEKGHRGHFDDWPAAREFHHALATVFDSAGRLVISRVRANGRLLAMNYAFRFGRRLHWFLAARSMDPEWHFCSPGRVGACDLIQRGIDLGLNEFEMGIGYYAYKVKLGGRMLPVLSIAAVRASVGARCRVRLLRCVAFLEELFGYRLWYLRVAPRLPVRRGGMSRRWIRRRLWPYDVPAFALTCRAGVCALLSILARVRQFLREGMRGRGLCRATFTAVRQCLARERSRYTLNVGDAVTDSARVDGVAISRHRVFRALDEAEVRQFTRCFGALSVMRVRQSLSRGGELWTASAGGELIGACWGVSGYDPRASVRDRAVDDFVVQDFAVAPAFRDRHVLRDMVRTMASTLAAEGARRLVIDLPAGDAPGGRMLLEAGFANTGSRRDG